MTDWLHGYAVPGGQPFLVLSDPLPPGYWRRPAVPPHLLGLVATDPQQRKALKGKRWLPESILAEPLSAWGATAKTDGELGEALGLDKQPLSHHEARTHNSLNRLTGTTGAGAGFAPYDRALTWYHPKAALALYAVIDADRTGFGVDELRQVLTYVGHHGYGKEASSGLGKFDVTTIEPWAPARPAKADAWLTLAPCAPQGLPWRADRCFYEVFTRFGRHGDRAVHRGNPFKNPVLMADSFALLTPTVFDPAAEWTGQGLSGLSRVLEATVQQAYAPVLAVQWQENVQ